VCKCVPGPTAVFNNPSWHAAFWQQTCVHSVRSWQSTEWTCNRLRGAGLLKCFVFLNLTSNGLSSPIHVLLTVTHLYRLLVKRTLCSGITNRTSGLVVKRHGRNHSIYVSAVFCLIKSGWQVCRMKHCGVQ